MADTREKLIELLTDSCNPAWKWFPNNAEMAALVDYLIANGVTVQEWISVKDRLPDMKRDVLVSRTWWNERKPALIGWYNEVTGNWYILTEDGYVINNKVTHWMPLPQPPKGE